MKIRILKSTPLYFYHDRDDFDEEVSRLEVSQSTDWEEVSPEEYELLLKYIQQYNQINWGKDQLILVEPITVKETKLLLEELIKAAKVTEAKAEAYRISLEEKKKETAAKTEAKKIEKEKKLLEKLKEKYEAV